MPVAKHQLLLCGKPCHRCRVAGSVDHAFVAAVSAAIRVKWMLKSGTQHDMRISAKNLFAAVAMVHVKIQDRNPLYKVMLNRVRHVVKKAESYGMMSGGQRKTYYS